MKKYLVNGSYEGRKFKNDVAYKVYDRTYLFPHRDDLGNPRDYHISDVDLYNHLSFMYGHKNNVWILGDVLVVPLDEDNNEVVELYNV